VYCTGDSTHCQVATGAFDNSEVPTNLSVYGRELYSVPKQRPTNHSSFASLFFMNQ
jgi:hypothetical protein